MQVTDSPITAALVSAGGSPAPILLVLRRHRPKHVWYFCSAGSRGNADAIQAELDWHPAPRFIEVTRFEELGPCYRELRRRIPEVLAESKVDPAEVLVDYTGGTKTMTAALVLASMELFDQFSYVGGEQREKSGLGVTLEGKERVLYQSNPWSDLAVREIERARDLWAGCQFETAAGVLRQVAPRVAHRLRFESIADLADAMDARHRLDFKAALRHLGTVQRSAPALFDGRDDQGLLNFVSESLGICSACSKDTASATFLGELLDNALRTAAQGRYEDAAARLYRAMEMQGQIWLAEATGGVFRNGRCRAKDRDRIPDSIRSLEFCHPDERGDIKFSLEQCYRALAAMGHQHASAVVADLGPREGPERNQSRWRAATEKRNTSILAHGVRPICAEGFAAMKAVATDYLGFNLTGEINPVLPLNPHWLE